MSIKGSLSLGNSDRGASAILVAFSLLLLFGMAALAVDAGLGFSDRRQQQSAADVGALAAVQFASTGLTSTHPDCGGLSGTDLAICRGAEEVLDVVEGTLPGRYSDTEWGSCVDSDKPSEYTQASAISDCISFTDNLQKARVVLPGSDVSTALARVLGFDSIRVSAFAEAGLDLDIIGSVLPFAIGPTGASMDQACFFASDTSNIDIYPCTSSTQGNFGKLSLYLYGNTTYGTTQACSGNNADRMASNIVVGSDHPLETLHATPGSIVNDDTNCPNISNPVDQIETWTGNAAGALMEGFFQGISSPSLEGRLLCKGSLSSDETGEDYPMGPYTSLDCKDVNDRFAEDIDDSPLWSYLKSGSPSEVATGDCQPGGGAIGNRTEMEACLRAWKDYGSHSDWLFDKDLITSPRFGAVPILDSDPSNGFSSYNIIGFLPVYLETFYLKCNANSCDVVFSPGEGSAGACPNPLTGSVSSCGWSSNGNKGIEAITAYILSLDMLHPDVAEKFPSRDGTITFNLSR